MVNLRRAGGELNPGNGAVEDDLMFLNSSSMVTHFSGSREAVP
jgi:hypothetical protein